MGFCWCSCRFGFDGYFFNLTLLLMRAYILKESDTELRVSASPESVKKMVELGISVNIQTTAGQNSNFSDESYKANGAEIFNNTSEISNADIIIKVNKPTDDEISSMKEGSLFIGSLDPYNSKETLNKLKNKGVTSFAMELMPRITRAQSMDILSSQSNLAGYKAVIDATYLFNKAMPMMMTAAGTIAPAKVMVFGAGVAGLQAIATAKRLGAIVSATDVRMAAKEQVESLGGKFVMVEDDESQDAETSGGYAKEMSDEFKAKQAKLISDTLATQDIAICTALIPGKKAPTLISEEQVRTMKPGSIIIDLAAESGGNCECSVAGETKEVGGVYVVGSKDITSTISEDASALFSKNILNFLTLLIDSESNSINIDWEDEIIKGILVTKNNEIVHKELS
jgi:NAD(P) transhydrogenase subunit alpha